MKLPALAAAASLASIAPAVGHETRAPKCLNADVLQVFGSVVRNDMAEQLYFGETGAMNPRKLGMDMRPMAEVAEDPNMLKHQREAARRAVAASESATMNLAQVRDMTPAFATGRSCAANLLVEHQGKSGTLPVTYHAWFTEEGGVHVQVEGTLGDTALVGFWSRWVRTEAEGAQH